MSKTKTPLHIVGSGFSGLTLAWHLLREEAHLNATIFDIHIYEQNSRAGGMLCSYVTPHMLVESAANGMLMTPELAEFFQSISLEWLAPLKGSSARYFVRRGLRRYPLTFRETLQTAAAAVRTMSRGKSWRRPVEGESVFTWAERVGGLAFAQHVVSTGLQGIYSGDAKQMSAKLVLGSLFETKKAAKSKKHRGIVSFRGGMSELIEKLVSDLERRGVHFHYGVDPKFAATLAASLDRSSDLGLGSSSDRRSDSSSNPISHPNSEVIVVWAVKAHEVPTLKNASESGTAVTTAKVEMLPLVKVSVSFQNPQHQLRGFGALMDPDEPSRVLGFLANSCIFPGRGPEYNESWMLGGTRCPEILSLGNEELLRLVRTERARVFGGVDEISSFEVSRWPLALPHYTLALEKSLRSLSQGPNVYHTGNYLGRLGLGKIFEQNRELSQKIIADWKTK